MSRARALRLVAGFGTVSLLTDLVYETARSVAGPLLAGLGAGAVLVGVVGGLGEGAALLLRLFTGPFADRTRAYWTLVFLGYGLTVLAIPLLALTPVIGGVTGLIAACALLIAERVGKAIRTPARDMLIATAGRQIGVGKAFGLHELLDQIGAVAGPLLLAGTAVLTGDFRLGLALLAVPGLAALALLAWLRRLGRTEIDPELPSEPGERRLLPSLRALPPGFRRLLLFSGLATFGATGFPLLSFHLVHQELLAPQVAPVAYAVAMAVDAGAAVLTGLAFDRYGRKVLLVLPPLAALVPVFGFGSSIGVAFVGVLLWGAVLGVQESTLRAAVAKEVPAASRGSAYGLFGATLGVATVAGGALGGWLYSVSVPVLVTVIVLTQAAALITLVRR